MNQRMSSRALYTAAVFGLVLFILAVVYWWTPSRGAGAISLPNSNWELPDGHPLSKTGNRYVEFKTDGTITLWDQPTWSSSRRGDGIGNFLIVSPATVRLNGEIGAGTFYVEKSDRNLAFMTRLGNPYLVLSTEKPNPFDKNGIRDIESRLRTIETQLQHLTSSNRDLLSRITKFTTTFENTGSASGKGLPGDPVADESK